MSKIVRNVARIKHKQEEQDTTSIILLASSIERERTKFSKPSLVWEIIQFQIESVRKTFPHIDLIVVSRDNFANVLSVKEKYQLRLVPHLYEDNANEIQDIKFGLSPCLSHNVIIVCGNIIFSKNIITGIKNSVSKVLVDENDPQLKSDNIGVVLEKNRVMNFGYDIYPKWGKLIYFNKNDLPKFLDIVCDNSNPQKFLFEGLNQFIQKYDPLTMFSPRKYFLRKVKTGGDLKRGMEYTEL